MTTNNNGVPSNMPTKVTKICSFSFIGLMVARDIKDWSERALIHFKILPPNKVSRSRFPAATFALACCLAVDYGWLQRVPSNMPTKVSHKDSHRRRRIRRNVPSLISAVCSFSFIGLMVARDIKDWTECILIHFKRLPPNKVPRSRFPAATFALACCLAVDYGWLQRNEDPYVEK